jgi:hypothetical protein
LDSLLPVISSTMSQRPQAASHRSNVMLSSVDFSRHTKSRKSLCYRLYCPISGPWDLGLAFADRKFVTHPLNRLSTRTSRLLFSIISQLCCLCVCIVQPARFAGLAFSSFAVSRHVSSWHVPQFLPDRVGPRLYRFTLTSWVAARYAHCRSFPRWAPVRDSLSWGGFSRFHCCT